MENGIFHRETLATNYARNSDSLLLSNLATATKLVERVGADTNAGVMLEVLAAEVERRGLSASVIHSVSLAPRTHCGIALTERPPITGNIARATCPDCKTVRINNGWKI